MFCALEDDQYVHDRSRPRLTEPEVLAAVMVSFPFSGPASSWMENCLEARPRAAGDPFECTVDILFTVIELLRLKLESSSMNQLNAETFASPYTITTKGVDRQCLQKWTVRSVAG